MSTTTTECGNPLLLRFLEDQTRDYQAKHRVKELAVYKRACQSMRECPRRFDHPSEAECLTGIGPGIAKWLEDKMQEYCLENGIPYDNRRRRKKRQSNVSNISNAVTESPIAMPSKRKPTKTYVPKLRSGGYALLRAMHDAMEDHDDTVGFTKEELCEMAQKYCESSFTVPNETSKFHTAWSSINTLEKNGLTARKGRPARYFLLDDGWSCAEKLKNVAEGNVGPAVESPRKRRRKEKEPMTSTAQGLISGQAGMANALGLNNMPPIGASMITATGASRQDNQCSILPASTSTSTAASGLRAPTFVDLLDSDDDDNMATPQLSQTSNLFIPDSSYPVSSYVLPMAQRIPRQTLPTTRLDRSNELITLPNHAPFSPSILPSGSYTVHLILDNREKRSTEDREYIPTELTKLGVPFLQRGLSLGDALWIAKPRDPTSVDEYILPHICERKRLDDLISSIKDKRFHEQKFRLARCGIPAQSITYIIEEYSLSEQQKSEHTERINTAKAETQIVNGFFVKCTQKLDETIRYLALMTKSLQDLYAEKPLYVIPQSHIDARTYCAFCASLQSHPQHADKTFTIPLSTFGDLTSKSGALNLRDLYLKMLMCTRNISGEKAIEIQRVWPTPRALIEAFERKATDKERENMVAEGLRGCVGRKKIAAVLSKKVAAVWGGVGCGVSAANNNSGNRGKERNSSDRHNCMGYQLGGAIVAMTT